ncbi:DgyrCDS8069 [Dimorphilus gyrociliatus]|nr:DgyrCDS8069 [Dimorphilus gyrociliatus]
MWIPKLAIGNSANKLFDGEHYRRFWITVRHDGSARWQPGGVFAISCALNMNFYPFDDQKCTIELETWVYTADKVNLSNSMDVIGLDTYIKHGEWDIIKTQVSSVNRVYRYYQDQFPEVYFTLHIRRKYTFYLVYILLPCLMLSGVLLMIFLVPAESGEKVSLGVSILVAISVFLLLVAGNVPDTSDAIPIIAIYLTYFMMANTIAVAMAVLVIRMHFRSADHAPPNWLRTLILVYIARLIGWPLECEAETAVKKIRKKKKESDQIVWTETIESSLTLRASNHNNETERPGEHLELLTPVHPTTSNGKVKNDWKLMAEIMDKFFFYLFLFFLIAPTVVILVVVKLFKPQL